MQKDFFRNKSILVTGGAGFIGSHIARKLVNLKAKVVIIDNLYSGKIENIKDIRKNVSFYKADIRDKKGLHSIFKRHRFHYVSHQAALRSVPLSMKIPQEFIDVNIKGTFNLLELSCRFRVKVFVNASSSSAYGERKMFPEREEDFCLPFSFYAMTKLSSEHICHIYFKHYGLNTVSLRYFNVYGPYQNLDSQYAMVVPKFITSFLKNRPCPIYGDGLQERDFTYIDDVVDSNIQAFLRSRSWGKVFNVAGGCSQKVINIYRSLKNFANKDVGIKFFPPRPGDVRKTQASLDNSRRFLGYKPRIDFEEGLRRTFMWFDKNRWFWEK